MSVYYYHVTRAIATPAVEANRLRVGDMFTTAERDGLIHMFVGGHSAVSLRSGGLWPIRDDAMVFRLRRGEVVTITARGPE